MTHYICSGNEKHSPWSQVISKVIKILAVAAFNVVKTCLCLCCMCVKNYLNCCAGSGEYWGNYFMQTTQDATKFFNFFLMEALSALSHIYWNWKLLPPHMNLRRLHQHTTQISELFSRPFSGTLSSSFLTAAHQRRRTERTLIWGLRFACDTKCDSRC